MNIILIIFLVLIGFWSLGVLAAGYHVFSFRFPGDKTVAYFTAFLIYSSLLVLLLLNWVFAAYFKG